MCHRFAALVALVVASPAFADQARPDPRRWEFGIAAGVHRLEVPDLDWGKSKPAYAVHLGYRFNPNLSAEVAYIWGARIRLTDGSAALRLKGDALTASLVGAYWVTPAIAPYARLGVGRYDAGARLNIPSAGVRAKESGTDLLWGVGVQGLFEGALVRLEYQRLDPEDTRNHFTTLGVTWLF